MNKVFSLCLLLLAAHGVCGQDLPALEAEIAEVQYVVGSAATDEEREAASANLREKLIKAFKAKGVFEYPFATLHKVGILESGDGAFRLFTWNRPTTQGSYVYHALLLFPGGAGYTELVHTPLEEGIDPKRIYTEKDWYGALYYHIKPVKEKGQTYYTLLGWDGAAAKSNFRVLDALTLDKKGRAEFGHQVFQTQDGYANRRVFEYAKDAKMMLDWLPARASIVFNDLAPITGAAEGNYAFYGPSGAYHAYALNDGQWQLEEYIDMSRPKSEEEKPQFNFPARPDLNKIRAPENPLIGK